MREYFCSEAFQKIELFEIEWYELDKDPFSTLNVLQVTCQNLSRSQLTMHRLRLYRFRIFLESGRPFGSQLILSKSDGILPRLPLRKPASIEARTLIARTNGLGRRWLRGR